VKKIGFLSFGHWTPAPYSDVRTASSALLHGLIANYREYWNPMAFTAAMRGTRFDNSAE